MALEKRLLEPVKIPEGEIPKTRGCVSDAFRLRELNSGMGKIFYVFTINVSSRIYHINQTYYLQDPKESDALALNGRDNGYYYAPPLTVGDVLRFGYDLDEIEQLSNSLFSKPSGE